MYRRIDHIGIAVRSLEAALKVYEQILGFELDRIEEVPNQGVRIAILPIGESRLELLEATEADSPVARFIARRGEGMHHICFEVDDIEREIENLKARGVRMIDESPRPGAGLCLVAFVHPSSTGGVLVELSQRLDRGSKLSGE